MRLISKIFSVLAGMAVAVLAGLAVFSCERFVTAPQNSSFEVMAEVGAARANGDVPVTLILSQGTIEGTCLLSTTIIDVHSGYEPSVAVLLNGETRMGPRTEWSFDERGRAALSLSGLVAGEYEATFCVTRWYHTATTKCRIIVN